MTTSSSSLPGVTPLSRPESTAIDMTVSIDFWMAVRRSSGRPRAALSALFSSLIFEALAPPSLPMAEAWIPSSNSIAARASSSRSGSVAWVAMVSMVLAMLASAEAFCAIFWLLNS